MRRSLLGPLAVTIIAFCLVMSGGQLKAQTPTYPTKPVKMIVPYPPGGIGDLSARAITEVLKSYFPQPISVINKGGGAAVIGTAEIISSTPDGYTLGAIPSTVVTLQPNISSDIPFKGPGDLRPIIPIIHSPFILVTQADTNWKTLKEVVAYAKANPGKYRIGHGGLGTPSQICFLLFLQSTGVSVTDVPLTGAQGVASVLGAQVDAVIMGPNMAYQHVVAGKLRFLAIWAEQRMQQIPDVPTFKELGYDIITEGYPFILVAPKATPGPIVDVLYSAFDKARKSDVFKKWALDNFCTLYERSPDELARDLDARVKFYADFVKKVKIQ